MTIPDSLSDFARIFWGVGWRHGHGLIEPITPFFILPSSHHSLCSLPSKFRSKAKQFPEVWIGGSKQKNRRSDFFVGYCTTDNFKILCFCFYIWCWGLHRQVFFSIFKWLTTNIFHEQDCMLTDGDRTTFSLVKLGCFLVLAISPLWWILKFIWPHFHFWRFFPHFRSITTYFCPLIPIKTSEVADQKINLG